MLSKGIERLQKIEKCSWGIAIIYKAVKREVDKWNPYGLLPDASGNEFDGESESVARLIRYDSSLESIARAVSKVFLMHLKYSILLLKSVWMLQFRLRKRWIKR